MYKRIIQKGKRSVRFSRDRVKVLFTKGRGRYLLIVQNSKEKYLEDLNMFPRWAIVLLDLDLSIVDLFLVILLF